ncbi:MAG: polyprenyl synthetase family protein [Deltaproteobacteria bacterium]|nr:MAG: polyprenyl synthetase family protein [Deltaproteobacteria bacterium]
MKVKSLEAYRPAIVETWETLLPQILGRDEALQPMLQHHLQVVGKLLRPMLTVAFYDLLLSSDENQPKYHDQVRQAAIAIELLHNGTLVHDDLQDGDEVRRGQPTVWKSFSPYQAINAGNALYFHAQSLLATLELPAEITVQLCRQLAGFSLDIINGQAAEKNLWPRIASANNFPGMTHEEATQFYLSIVEGKTSALFSLPLMTASTIAGEDVSIVEALTRIADPLGALFQIQDDLLDLFGDKGRDSVGNDIAEGKPSLPALHCMYLAEPTDAKWLFDLIQKPREETQQEDIQRAIGLIQDSGALRASLNTIEELRTTALKRCRELPLRVPPEPLANFLDGLCDTILQPIQHLYIDTHAA